MYALVSTALFASATAQPATLTWQGQPNTANFDSSAAWVGGNPVPSAGMLPSMTTFGTTGSQPLAAAFSSTVDVGSQLTFMGASQVVFNQGAQLTFTSRPSASAATFVTAQTGFGSIGGASQAVASTAASYDFNCPFNWRPATGSVNSVPFNMAPMNQDTLTIPGSAIVSTFGAMFSAGSINGVNGNQVCQSPPPNTNLLFGTGCQYTPSNQVTPTCGNLGTVKIPGSAANTDVYVFTCPDFTDQSCPLGGMAIVVNNATRTAYSKAATYNAGSNSYSVKPESSHTVGANGAIAPASDDSAGVPLLIIVIIIAAVVIIGVIAFVVVKKKNGSPPPSQQKGVPFGGVGFENPLYDDSTKDADAAAATDADYMDLPEGETAEGGYMDVPAEGDDAMYEDGNGGEGAGGYMDVSPEDDGDY